MTIQSIITGLLCAAGILVLILDGQTALLGAGTGLDLCIRTVIPSLFPFLFLTSLLTNTLWGNQFPWLRSFTGRLGIPRGAESLLIPAFFGGYPAGAGAVGDSYRSGRLSREDAVHLLYFCSNAGPAFLFGMISRAFDGGTVWILWTIQLLSAAATAVFIPFHSGSFAALTAKRLTVPQILRQSVSSMGLICGWIVLFQVFIAFLNRWFLWLLPEPVTVLITGFLELSSGCCALNRITDPAIRFLVCSLLLSFGGTCVFMQTASVIAPLPTGPYFRGKLIQSAISLVLSLLYLELNWPVLVFSGMILLFFPAGSKNKSGFPEISGV